MHEVLVNLLLVLGSATVVATLFHAVKLPAIVGFLASGVLIGPHGLGWVKTLPEVEVLNEIAAVLLMFTIGLEFSLKRLFQLKRLWALFVITGLGCRLTKPSLWVALPPYPHLPL